MMTVNIVGCHWALLSYELFHSDETSLVDLLCTPFILFLSFLRWFMVILHIPDIDGQKITEINNS